MLNEGLFRMMSDLKVSDDAGDAEVIQSLSSMTINECGESVTQEIKEDKKEPGPRKKLPIVDFLSRIQKRFDHRSSASRSLPVYPLGESEEDSRKRFQHMAKLIDIMMFRAVHFIKLFPDYTKLDINDVVLASVGSMMHLIVLEAARKYDINTESIVFIKNHPYTYLEFQRAELGYLAQCLFPFCKTLNELNLDDTVYALLKVIMFYAESPKYRQPCQTEDFQQPKRMECYRKFYVEKLRKHISAKHSLSQNYLDWLSLTVNELHVVSMKIIHSIQNHKYAANVTPLMKEAWKISA